MYPSEKDKTYFFELLSRYNSGTTTPAETEFVVRFLAILEYRRTDALADFDDQKKSIEDAIEQRLLSSIGGESVSIRQETPASSYRPAAHRVHFLRAGRWAAAAVLLICLSAGAYFFTHRVPSPPVAGIVAHNDINPGKAGALLTLSDGRQISLDSLQNGMVAMQGNAEVKIQNGSLVYNKTHNRHGEETTVYNTISTPRGRQFQLILPEGTKVWLNAASSLRYPVAFTGGERKVEITGEACFEVSRNAHLPFRVKVNDRTEVEVLGTFFNINAYGDEAGIKTTLLEGAVKVSSGGLSQLLSPGQQAQVSPADGSLALIGDADVNQAIAWKNGAFSFHNSSLDAVMRQIARWYDIEVEYRGAMPTGSFSGEIDRSLTLDQVLKGLTKTRIHYRIEKEKKLIILP